MVGAFQRPELHPCALRPIHPYLGPVSGDERYDVLYCLHLRNGRFDREPEPLVGINSICHQPGNDGPSALMDGQIAKETSSDGGSVPHGNMAFYRSWIDGLIRSCRTRGFEWVLIRDVGC